MSKFNCKTSVTPNGLEKYMSFTLKKASLDELVKNLSNEDFKDLSEEFSYEKLELVKKRGIYPYEYFNSFLKNKKTNLPGIDKFFSSLKVCSISEKEYQRVCDVWKVFKIKKIGRTS